MQLPQGTLGAIYIEKTTIDAMLRMLNAIGHRKRSTDIFFLKTTVVSAMLSYKINGIPQIL